MSRLIRELRRRAFPFSRAATLIAFGSLAVILAFARLHLRADYYSDDSDSDGLFDYEEDLIGTDPWIDDSDYDGWLDGEEYWGGWDPLDSNSNPGGGDGGSGDSGGPMDSDSDGLSDEDEINTYGTNPNESDSDFDSFSDYDEIFVLYSDPNNSSDPDSSSSSGGDGSGSGSGSGDSGGDGSGSGDGSSGSGDSGSSSDSGGDSGSTPEISSGLPDSDGDGLSDAFELANGGDPNDPIEGQTDSDGDGLPDLWEQVYPSASDPGGDTDGDSLDNLNEFHYQTNPAAADTDGDGVNDGDEVYGTVFWPGDPLYDYYAEPWDPFGAEVQEEIVFQTDPTNPDTDYDELPDGYELANGYNPVDPSEATFDEDGDGLLLPLEYQLGTVDWNTDSDGDGMPDKWEYDHGLDPATNDGAEDPDSDGLVNVLEYQHGTLPFDPDTDDDGIRDGAEVNAGLDPNNAADGANADSDGDGILNGVEVFYGLDPKNAADGQAGVDNDNDGISNKDEADAGSDPNNSKSTPNKPRPFPVGASAESDGEGTPVVVSNSGNDTKLYPGQTVTIVLHIYSEEYPYWTEDNPEYNDTVGWEVKFDGAEISGAYDVNTKHAEFVLSFEGLDGGEYTEVLGKFTNNSDQIKPISVTTTVTNIDDGNYPTIGSIQLIYAEEVRPESGFDGYLRWNEDERLERPWLMVPGDGDRPNSVKIGGAGNFEFPLELDKTDQVQITPTETDGDPTQIEVQGVYKDNDEGVVYVAESGNNDGSVLGLAGYERRVVKLTIHSVTLANDDVDANVDFADGNAPRPLEVDEGKPHAIAIRRPANDSGIKILFTGAPGGDDKKVNNTITTGANGICETTANAADEQVIQPGKGEAFFPIITPGDDGVLNTIPADGDTIENGVLTTGPDGIRQTPLVSGDVAPQEVPTAEELETFLNRIFGDQANIFFEVTRNDVTVDYDIGDPNNEFPDFQDQGRNGEFDHFTKEDLTAEEQALRANAFDPEAKFNLYYLPTRLRVHYIDPLSVINGNPVYKSSGSNAGYGRRVLGTPYIPADGEGTVRLMYTAAHELAHNPMFGDHGLEHPRNPTTKAPEIGERMVPLLMLEDDRKRLMWGDSMRINPATGNPFATLLKPELDMMHGLAKWDRFKKRVVLIEP